MKLLLTGWFLLVTQILFSQMPGTLDLTFGNGGIVLTPAGNMNTSTKTVLVQPDGKIVVAGETFDIHPGYDIVIARTNPDGSLDPSFGNNGINLVETPGMTTFIFAAVLLLDGKILLGGSSSPIGTTNTGCCFLARFTSDGLVDGSFGVNGFVFDWITNNSEIYALALQADGKIVAAGSSLNASLLPVATTIRYDNQGQRDPAFGTNGVVVTMSSQWWCQFTSIECLPDGRILAAGSSSYNNQPNLTCFLLVRYLANGTPDPAFGENGIDLSGKLGPISFSFGLKALTDGKIILAGRRVDDQGGFTVARYKPDGGLDPFFGSAGSVSTAIGNPLKDICRTMTVQPDDKIILAGITYPLDGTAPRLVLLRYLQAGIIDNQFGNNGFTVTDMGQSKNYAYDIALQNDGKILVTSGYWQAVGSGELSFARFHGGDTLVGVPPVRIEMILKLYPNPATELITLEIPSHYENGSGVIFDATGKSKMEIQLRPPQTTFDIRTFEKGLYVIKINSLQGLENHRFIKN